MIHLDSSAEELDLQPFKQAAEAAIKELPKLLLMPHGTGAPSPTTWVGQKMDPSWSDNAPTILPFVDREVELARILKALHSNMVYATFISHHDTVFSRSLTLVGAGSLFGAGKTRIGDVLPGCISKYLRAPVIHRTIEEPTEQSLLKCLLDVPVLRRRRRPRADSDLTSIIQELDVALEKCGSFLYLHLDEFIPSMPTG